MEPEARYTVVGAAVLLLLAGIAAALLWLRDTGERGEAQTYKIYFTEHSLEGLAERSDVKMRGIRIGSVTGFRISRTVPGAVEVFIRVDEDAPIRQSTRAVVDRHLVTGIADIRLVNLTDESPPLVSAPAGEPFPVIAEGESQLQQVSETVTQLAQRASETMQRINSLLSERNQEAVADTLQNLRRLSASADRLAERLEGTLVTFDKTLVSVAATSEEVREMSNVLVADARDLVERYEALGGETQVAVGEIGEAVRRMSADLARLTARAEGLLETGDEELRATAQALRAASASLSATARRLGDPGTAVFGPPEGALGPGERAR